MTTLNNRDFIVGWDLGGAHAKAVVINSDSQVEQVLLASCPLWQGLEQLDQALKNLNNALKPGNYHHALTMTGECVDLFENRTQGVKSILQRLSQHFPPERISIYSGLNGFKNYSEIEETQLASIASANWLASAQYTATQASQGLFIDIGSTTTDILLFKKQQVMARAYNDYERLVSGELVYTGIARTPVMALTQRAHFLGQEQGLMAEYFATMADVYRLTGELQEQYDLFPSADGREKSAPASALRLSRMTGYDFKLSDMPIWQQFARTLRTIQVKQIQESCIRQLDSSRLQGDFFVVGAGIGRFLVKELAENLKGIYRDFDELLPPTKQQTEIRPADCAPALAVAQLYKSSGQA